jgi:hypothetical protein
MKLAGLLGTSVLLVLTLIGNSQAAVVTWNGASGLQPDEITQPYELIDSASPEDPVLSAGVLTLASDPNAELLAFKMSGDALSMPATPQVEFTMRMVSHSSQFPLLSAGAAVTITTQNSVGNTLYIGIDEVFFLTTGGNRGPSAIVDTDSSFHDYRIEIAGLSSGSAITLFQDNIEILSHVLSSNPSNYGVGARIAFGDITGIARGTSEWTFFQHNAAPPLPPSVPAGSDLGRGILLALLLVAGTFTRTRAPARAGLSPN